MAAILCESISKVLRGCCEGLGTVCSIPFRACGIAGGELAKICSSPFCLFLSVALGLNLPPVVFAGRTLFAHYSTGGDEGCHAAATWLYVNAALCAANIGAAVYMSTKIAQSPLNTANATNAAPFIKASVMGHEATKTAAPSAPPQSSILNETQYNKLDRVKEILCYDPWVAAYILVGIFYMVWQTVGISRSSLTIYCEAGVEESVLHSIICGFLFISLGGVTFACSVCCLARN